MLVLIVLHTHGDGWVHRDISPGNILLDKDGKRVILSDLEYAKSLADDRSHEIRTVTSFILNH
jgi:serine/threonine protein kinase